MKEYLKKNYNEGNDIFGYPQIYKNIEFYPILLKDTKMHQLFYHIFGWPTQYISDPTILKMSYLEFYLFIVQSKVSNEQKSDELIELLKYITKKNVEIGYKTFSESKDFQIYIKIDNIEISEWEFNDIREIVLEQNGLSIEYIEAYRPDLEEHLRFMNRNNDGLDFKDEIFTFVALGKIGLEELKKYTLFQFKNVLERILILKEYEILKPPLLGGTIELKGGELKHYLYHSIKKNRYDSIFIDAEKFVNDYGLAT